LLLAVAAMCMFVSVADAASSVDHWGTYLNGEKGTLMRPTVLPALTGVSTIDASNSSGYAIKEGHVEAWGNNARGQLGDGLTANSLEAPVRVHLPEGVTAVSLGEARNTGIAIDSSGHAYGWGEAGLGDLCRGGVKQLTPVPIPGLSGLVQVQGGENHTLWLTSAGKVYGCGSNEHGELGLGESIERVTTATLIPGLPANVVEVSAGSRSSAVRTSDGRVFTFGDNVHGQECVGSTAPYIYQPHEVTLPAKARQISAGGDLLDNGSLLILTVTNELIGCGDDEAGQLGDRSLEDKRSPVATGLHFKTAVTGGAESFGLTETGELFGWGSASVGALGNGRFSGRVLKPELTLTGVSSISATAVSAVAIRP
jgi:alpha-tubulin suppressor-like RCC1 family protein